MEHHRRQHAVDVVIPEDQDGLLFPDRFFDPGDGRVHAGKQERVGDVLQAGFEEKPGPGGVRETAIGQNLPEDRRQSEGGGQGGSRGRGRGDAPDRFAHFIFHFNISAGRLKARFSSFR